MSPEAQDYKEIHNTTQQANAKQPYLRNQCKLLKHLHLHTDFKMLLNKKSVVLVTMGAVRQGQLDGRVGADVTGVSG